MTLFLWEKTCYLLNFFFFFLEKWEKWNIGLASISSSWHMLNRGCQIAKLIIIAVGNIFLSILLCWLFHSLLPITGRHLNFFLQSNKGCIKRKVKQDRAQNFTFRISFWHLLECMEPMNHNIVSQAVKIGLWTFSEMESVTKAHIKAVGGIYFNSYNFLVSWNSVLN